MNGRDQGSVSPGNNGPPHSSLNDMPRESLESETAYAPSGYSTPHEVIAYALFGMNLERPQELNTLFSEALDSLSSCMCLATRRDGRNT